MQQDLITDYYHVTSYIPNTLVFGSSSMWFEWHGLPKIINSSNEKINQNTKTIDSLDGRITAESTARVLFEQNINGTMQTNSANITKLQEDIRLKTEADAHLQQNLVTLQGKLDIQEKTSNANQEKLDHLDLYSATHHNLIMIQEEELMIKEKKIQDLEEKVAKLSEGIAKYKLDLDQTKNSLNDACQLLAVFSNKLQSHQEMTDAAIKTQQENATKLENIIQNLIQENASLASRLEMNENVTAVLEETILCTDSISKSFEEKEPRRPEVHVKPSFKQKMKQKLTDLKTNKL